jgi:uncharacterized protein (TIGR02246 family)
LLEAAQWHDKLAIREVIEQYMRWNDDGDFPSIVGLFTDDATLQFFGRILVGRDAIAEFFAGMFPVPPAPWTEGGSLFLQPRSIHISSNPVITVTATQRRPRPTSRWCSGTQTDTPRSPWSGDTETGFGATSPPAGG